MDYEHGGECDVEHKVYILTGYTKAHMFQCAKCGRVYMPNNHPGFTWKLKYLRRMEIEAFEELEKK